MNQPKLNTQKKLFLNALEELDIEILDYILSDDITYFGANKKTFINKMDSIFNQVRLGGWKENLQVVVSKKHLNTYYLNLKIYHYKLKFIITEDNDTITSITNNLKVKSKEDVETLSTLELFFGLDERASFVPDTEYVMTKYKCDIAYKEIKESDKPLTFDIIKNWLNSHKELYQNCSQQYLYFQFHKFTDLYFSNEFLFEMLQHYKLAQEALSEYQNPDFSLSIWKEKYFELAYCKALQFHDNFKSYNKETKIAHSFVYPYTFYQGEEFITLIEFSRIYFSTEY